MTFHPSIALHFGQGFFLPNFVAIGHSWAIWPLVDPGWPLHVLWPHQCTLFWSGCFLPNLVVIEHSWAIWPLLTPVDPCMTFDPGNALHFSQQFFPPNLGAIGHFKSNLTTEWPLTFGRMASKICSQTPWGPSPTPMPTFSSIPRSTTAYLHTYIQIGHFSSIDFILKLGNVN